MATLDVSRTRGDPWLASAVDTPQGLKRKCALLQHKPRSVTWNNPFPFFLFRLLYFLAFPVPLSIDVQHLDVARTKAQLTSKEICQKLFRS